MRLKRRVRKNKYFSDVFIFVFVFVLAISLAFFLSFEYHRIFAMRQEQAKHEHIMLENYANKIDREIKEAFEFADLLLLEPLATEFVQNDKMDQYDKIQLFKRVAVTTPKFEISGAEVIMYKPGEDCFISEKGIEHLYDMNKKYGSIPFTVDEVYKFDENKPARLYGEYANAVKDEYIAFLVRKTTYIGNDICFIVSVDKNSLENDLKNGQINGFYINSNKNILFEYSKTSDTAKNKVVYKASTALPQCEYGIVTDVFKVPFYFAIRFSLIVLLIIVIAAYVSRLIATKLYKVFENISGKLFDKNIESDEIASLKTAFDKMLEKRNELKNNREKYEKILRNDLMKKILVGKASKNEIEERTLLFPLDVQCDVCVAVCIFSDDEYSDESLLKNNLYDSFVKKMNSRVSSECVELNMETSVFVYPWNKRNIAEALMIDSLAAIEQAMNVRIKMIIVDCKFTSLSDISGLYGEVRSFCENQLLSDENIIHHYNYETMKSSKYYYPMEIENKLISFVREGNKEECYALFEHLIDVNVNEKVLSSADLVEFKMALIITARRVVEMFGLTDLKTADEEELREKLFADNNTKNLSSVLYEYYNNVFAAVSAKKNNKQSLLFNEVNKYVAENFSDTDKVSVVNIASRFNISVGYISKLYKKMTGKTFIDYVLDVRIARAKSLLLEQKTLKIKEIGESVGYSNVTSFVRYFKKMTGLTPNEYRTKYTGTNDDTEN